MSENNYTAKLLGMEDVEIKDFRENERKVEITFRLPRGEQHCPACGAKTKKIHDYRIRNLRDLEVSGRRLELKYERRRYVCVECGKRFAEMCTIAGKYQRVTHAVTQKTIKLLHERLPMTQIAGLTSSSVSAVRRVLDRLNAPKPKELPFVISFDEFKGNTDGEKYQCIITDPIGRKIIDILPSRKVETVQGYLKSFANRADVRYAIIDMNGGFKNVIKTFLPNAKIIIDRFHVVRYCTQAVDNVRRELQKKLPKHQRKYFKHARRLLLAHRDKLSEVERGEVDVLLRFSEKLSQAYALKESFYYFMDAADRNEAVHRLSLWLDAYERLQICQFSDLHKLLRNWRRYILNAFDVPLTNAFTEGTNNVIKVIKRSAFGFRSFTRFRKRIIFADNPYPYY